MNHCPTPNIGSAASEKYTTHTPGACGRCCRSTYRCHQPAGTSRDVVPSSASRRGSCLLLCWVGRAVRARGLQQAFARSILGIVDDRAIPGQPMGAPPHQADQDPKLITPAKRRRAQVPWKSRNALAAMPTTSASADPKRHGPLETLLDRDPPDQHGREHEAGHHPVQPFGILSLVEHPQQEEHQAADQRHDQRRADGDHHVVGQSLVKASGHAAA